ncbi:MAG: M20/M25/M40 family metallo-hydrolase [Bacteroidales bacterium]
MHKGNLPILALLLILSVRTEAQPNPDPVLERIIETGRTDNRTMDHLDVLCNRFGGRLIGSDAYENAALWAAHTFASWGMDVVMDDVGTLPVGFNRGPWFGTLLGEEGMHLHFATPSYTSGTKGVQRGPVLLEPRTREEMNQMKGALKGAWVLIGGENTGFPVDISTEADRYRDSLIDDNVRIRAANADIRKQNREREARGKESLELLKENEEPALFYRDMVEAGILGIIQSAPVPIRVLYDRKNLHRLRFDSLPSVPDIKLDEHQFAVIKRMAEERRYFQLEFDIRNHFKMGPVPYHNVIGIIPGFEFPDEYVIMSAHLDAYDVATGGVDDGSGVSPVMEAARLIQEAGGRPRRTILVILWAGEEFGLYGSRSWVARHADSMDRISNLVNRDGGPTVPVALKVTSAQRPLLEDIAWWINRIDPAYPFALQELEARPRPLVPMYTDAGPFQVAGVPTQGFECADPQGTHFDYREIWHTERDLYNKSIPEYQNQAAVATAVLVYGLANLDGLLPREGVYLSPVPEDNRP